MSDFQKAILKGNVEEVARLLENENCDVNQNVGQERNFMGHIIPERPLSISLKKITSENDEWFKISKLLIQHKNINLNARCGQQEW